MFSLSTGGQQCRIHRASIREGPLRGRLLTSRVPHSLFSRSSADTGSASPSRKSLGGFFLRAEPRKPIEFLPGIAPLVPCVANSYNEGMATGLLPDPRAGLRLPQFGLRTLFFVVALLGVLFAVMAAIGPAASAALLLGLAIVGLHVVGNRVGTALRDGVDAELARNASDEARRRQNFTQIQRSVRTQLDQPVSGLYQRTRLSRLNRVLGGFGAAIGAAAGYAVLANWTAASIGGLVVGSVSSAVLGGGFGFLWGSFLEAALCAWWQAASEAPSRDRSAISKNRA